MPKGVHNDITAKAKVVHRLKIARGHLDKVIRMAESDAYCIDVVHQSLAVSAALKKIEARCSQGKLAQASFAFNAASIAFST